MQTYTPYDSIKVHENLLALMAKKMRIPLDELMSKKIDVLRVNIDCQHGNETITLRIR